MRTKKMARKVLRLAQRVQKVQWEARAEGFSGTSTLLSEVVVTLMQAHGSLLPPATPQIIEGGEDYGCPFTE